MLADLVLILHAAFVLFVVGGLLAIWIGAALQRAWCVNPWFRSLHLAAIGIVAAESVLGVACPLTVWEAWLRGTTSDTGFIQRWVGAVLYWNAPTWVFTSLYLAFAALVAWTWLRIPPRWHWHPPDHPG
jgi:Protein of Unknown function (DUF2784)